MFLESYRGAIERYLRSIHADGDDVSKMSSEAVMSGGKRIRPILTLLVCEAVSGNYEKALPVASAYELAHGASLVQDDIIDESETRHGRPAVHERYGLLRAILISDNLLFDIFTELSKYQSLRISKRSLSELLGFVGGAAKMAARGEFYEASLKAKGNSTEKEYLKLAELKTGSFFAGAAASGAVVGGARKPVVEAMYRFGLALGVSFQIEDDMLDIAGDTGSTGKPILKDVQGNASNLVLIHALNEADPYQKQIIESMLYKKWFARSDVKRLNETLDQLGSFEHSSRVAHKYAETARNTLRVLSPSDARDKFEGITHGLEVRSS
jgi:geranylgeranyl pyrophosphate synthase